MISPFGYQLFTDSSHLHSQYLRRRCPTPLGIQSFGSPALPGRVSHLRDDGPWAARTGAAQPQWDKLLVLKMCGADRVDMLTEIVICLSQRAFIPPRTRAS